MHPTIRVTDSSHVVIDEPIPAGTTQQQQQQQASSATITADGTAGGGQPLDGADLVARLCSTERIKADDLEFWKKCMDGMEWAFYEQSVEVQSLIQQYCKKFGQCHACMRITCLHSRHRFPNGPNSLFSVNFPC